MKPHKSKPRKPPKGTITQIAAADLFKLRRHQILDYVAAGLKSWRRGRIVYVRPEDVREWRANHSHAGNVAKNPAPGTPVSEMLAKGELSAETPIERLNQMERQAFADYLAARQSNRMDAIRGAMKAYGDISKILAEAQKIEAYLETKKLEWWGECSQSLAQYAEPIRSLIDQLPRAVAQRCNPADPAAAEAVLSDWRDNQLFPMMARKLAT